MGELFRPGDISRRLYFRKQRMRVAQMRHGRLDISLGMGDRKPFDMLALTNEACLNEKAAGKESDGFSAIWLPVVDSFRTQLAVPSEEMLDTLALMHDVVCT